MPDTSREAIAAKITEIAQRTAESEGLEIVEVQVLGAGKARLVRIYIDRPNNKPASMDAAADHAAGVSHADCEFISRQVGTILDVEDVMPGDHYTLEVSSPGVERKLSKPADFERFVGKKAKLLLREPVENQRRWEGTLTGFAEGLIAIEPSAGRVIRIPLAQVEKANLKFEW